MPMEKIIILMGTGLIAKVQLCSLGVRDLSFTQAPQLS